MVTDLDDKIIRTATRILIPHIQIYSLYVLVHGHGSPGGGFQGGCIMAANFILLAVVYSLREAKKRFSERNMVIFSSLGVFIYAMAGAVPMFYGGNFLDYGVLSALFHTTPVMARYYGIAIIELGVQIAVMAVMVSIFFDLVTAGKHEGVFEEEDHGTDRR